MIQNRRLFSCNKFFKRGEIESDNESFLDAVQLIGFNQGLHRDRNI